MAGSHIGTALSFSPEGIITLSPPAVAPVFHKLSDVMYTVVNILIITSILLLLTKTSHCNGPLFHIFLLYSLPQPWYYIDRYYYYPHFSDVENEEQRHYVTSLASLS